MNSLRPQHRSAPGYSTEVLCAAHALSTALAAFEINRCPARGQEYYVSIDPAQRHLTCMTGSGGIKAHVIDVVVITADF